MAMLQVGVTALPDPVSIAVGDEIIWSTDTGRTLSGLMVGDVVAEKKKLSIEWGLLQASEVATIQNTIVAGFVPLTFRDGGDTLTIQVYRGTLTKEQIGELGDGIFWYRSASVELVQQ